MQLSFDHGLMVQEPDAFEDLQPSWQFAPAELPLPAATSRARRCDTLAILIPGAKTVFRAVAAVDVDTCPHHARTSRLRHGRRRLVNQPIANTIIAMATKIPRSLGGSFLFLGQN
jgi:hypothetical protein